MLTFDFVVKETFSHFDARFSFVYFNSFGDSFYSNDIESLVSGR